LLPSVPATQLPRQPYFKSSFCGSQLLGCRALHSSCISIFKEPLCRTFRPVVRPAAKLPTFDTSVSGDEKAALSGDEKICRRFFQLRRIQLSCCPYLACACVCNRTVRKNENI